MDYDEFLSHFGSFGWFNFLLLLINGLAGPLLMSLNGILINFLGSRVDHWCHVPGYSNLSDTEQKQSFIPWDESSQSYSSCHMYTDYARLNHVTAEPTNHNVSYCTDGWNFDKSLRRSTYISEWEMVCDSAWQTEFAVPLYITGQLLGSLICGSVSNKFGRKKSLFFFLFLESVCSAVGAFSVNLYMFIASRIVMGLAGISAISIAFVLAIEMTPSEQRVICGPLNDIIYSCGILLATGLAYYIREWRPLLLVSCVAAIPTLLIFALLVPESPRWLTWQNRRREAADVLARIAWYNRTTVSLDSVQEFFKQEKKDLSENKSDCKPARGTVADLFSYPVTRRCVLTIFLSWSTATFILTAVSFNLDNLFGDMYVNMAAIALVAIGTSVVNAFLIRHWGRIPTFIMSAALSAIFAVVAIVCLYVPGLELGVTVCAIMLRSCGVIGTVCGYTIILELFPTPIRNLVIGLGSGVSYGVSIVAPYIAGSLAQYWAPIPYITFGSASVISVFLLKWMPETKGIRMPETIEELENLKRRPSVSSSEADSCTKDNLGFNNSDEKSAEIYQMDDLISTKPRSGSRNLALQLSASTLNGDLSVLPGRKESRSSSLSILPGRKESRSSSLIISTKILMGNILKSQDGTQNCIICPEDDPRVRLDSNTYESLLCEVTTGMLEDEAIITLL